VRPSFARSGGADAQPTASRGGLANELSVAFIIGFGVSKMSRFREPTR